MNWIPAESARIESESSLVVRDGTRRRLTCWNVKASFGAACLISLPSIIKIL